MKIIDDSKLMRKLIFSFLGKENELLEWMRKTIFLDYSKENKNKTYLEYILEFYIFFNQDLNSPNSILFCLFMLYHSLKFVCVDVEELNEKKYLSELKRVISASNQIKNKISTSSMNKIISLLLNSLIYNLSLYAKNCSLDLKIEIFYLIVNENEKNKANTKFEKKISINNFLFEIPNVTLAVFFKKFILDDNKFTIKSFSDKSKIFCDKFKVLIKIFRLLIKNSNEDEKYLINEILEWEKFLFEFLLEIKDNDRFKNLFLYLQSFRKIKSFQKKTNSLNHLLSKLYLDFKDKNHDVIHDVSLHLKIFKFSIKYIEDPKCQLNEIINYLFELNKQNNSKFLKNFLKYSKIFPSNPFENHLFSKFLKENSIEKGISFEDLLRTMKIFNLAKEIPEIFKDFNFHSLKKLKMLVQEMEIVDQKDFRFATSSVLVIKDLQKEWNNNYDSQFIMNVLKQILNFLKSLKMKEIDEKKILKNFLVFIVKFYDNLKIISADESSILENIFDYLFLSHSKCCEYLTFFCLKNQKIFSLSFMNNLVIIF